MPATEVMVPHLSTVIAPAMSGTHQLNLAEAATTPTPHISHILTATIPDDSKARGKEMGGWKIFMQGLGVLKEVSVVFPPLQAAAAALFRVLEQVGVSVVMTFKLILDYIV
jgi:hypothetical protein